MSKTSSGRLTRKAYGCLVLEFAYIFEPHLCVVLVVVEKRGLAIAAKHAFHSLKLTPRSLLLGLLSNVLPPEFNRSLKLLLCGATDVRIPQSPLDILFSDLVVKANLDRLSNGGRILSHKFGLCTVESLMLLRV
jgi:hypothetical protein